MDTTWDTTWTRRQLLGASATLPFFATGARPAVGQPVLIELFTSQGCSSCPPADRLANELAKDKRYVVVSYNVDYWDYLGWKDTLARPEFTDRQRDYARSRGDSEIYTPQMVINGEFHAVGSRKERILSAVSHISQPPADIALGIAVSKTEVSVNLGATPYRGDATVWIMSLAGAIDVQIERGENAGQTITYHNVVRTLAPAGMYKGEAETLTLPRKAVVAAGATSCLVVVQKQMTGPVLSIAQVPVINA